MKAISFIFLTFFVLSNYVMADESVNKILKNIDELYRSKGSQGKIEMEVGNLVMVVYLVEEIKL